MNPKSITVHASTCFLPSKWVSCRQGESRTARHICISATFGRNTFARNGQGMHIHVVSNLPYVSSRSKDRLQVRVRAWQSPKTRFFRRALRDFFAQLCEGTGSERGPINTGSAVVVPISVERFQNFRISSQATTSPARDTIGSPGANVTSALLTSASEAIAHCHFTAKVAMNAIYATRSMRSTSTPNSFPHGEILIPCWIENTMTVDPGWR